MSSAKQDVPPRVEGRLSIEQKRTKKRELDRICQRRKRSKDRDHMKKLEEQVKFLQQQKDDVFVRSLLVERERNEARAAGQKSRLLQMQALLAAELAAFDDHQEETTGSQNMTSTTETDSTAASFTPTQSGQDIPSLEKGNTYIPESLLDLDDFVETQWSSQTAALNDCLDPLIHATISNHGTEERTWERIERSIFQAQQDTLHGVTQNTELDIHIIITAISIGWGSVAQVLPLDSRWNCLRQLDEDYFMPNYGKVERLAVLMISSQIFFRLDLRRSAGPVWMTILPHFVKPRPSQLAITHSVIADSYVWPGFRERLSCCNDYYTDTFLQATYSCFRFLWPHDVKDAYTLNQRTGLYQLSSDFLARIQELRCWTMDSDFLNKYPEFQGDIPVSNSIPTHMSLIASQPQFYHFSGRSVADQEEDNLDEGQRRALWPALDLEFAV